MAEKLSLTAPVTPVVPSTNDYSIRSLYFGWEEQLIQIVLRDNNGAVSNYTYTGSVATTLMLQLNKLNLSTQSLQARVLARLVADGKLQPGTVTGTPD